MSTKTQAAPWFEDVADDWGIDFQHDSGHDGRYLFPESVAGGICLLDYDGDGNMDIYFVQSGPIEKTGAATAIGNVLYHNLGGGRFTDVSREAGVADSGYGMGCACGDYDGDGDTDLYVTNVGANVMYRNNGDGTFTDVTASAGLQQSDWSSSAAFVDFDDDRDLDLYVVNYIHWSPEAERPCRAADLSRDYCAPGTYNAPAVDALYRNEGDGKFVDFTRVAGLDKAFGNGLGVACGHFNADDLVDIYVANDAVDNQLWINKGNGRFEDEAMLLGVAVSGYGMPEGSMGVAALDVDHDGDLDLFMSHLRDETNTFYLNEGTYFDDATGRTGLGPAGLYFTGFGLGFFDFDHDGHVDVYVANGRVMRAEPFFDPQSPFAEPNQLFAGLGDGKFEEVMPRGGTAELLVHASRGAAFGDLDNDGAIDIVVVNKDGPAYVLHNIAPKKGNSRQFRLVNRQGADAIGAGFVATLAGSDIQRYQQHYPSYGYCSSNDPRVHLGLGKDESIFMTIVRWTGDTVEVFPASDDIPVQILHEGQGRPFSP